MSLKSITVAIVLFVNLFNLPGSYWSTGVEKPVEIENQANLSKWTAYQVIDLVNGQRVAYGNTALVVDPILMATAQSTAEIMAANNMRSHIGDVRGRVQAAGYGAGDIPWATENFAVCADGSENMIASAWADASHQIPVVNSNYKHVGAGVAVASDGMVYYILHAAYTSNGTYESGSSSYTSSSSSTTSTDTDSTTVSSATEVASQYIYAVQTVTPSADGNLIHTVQFGQSMWSIAIAYNTHIVDIAELNNLDSENPVIWSGQELKIPYDGTFITSTPDELPDDTWQNQEITRTPISTLTPVLAEREITATIPTDTTQNELTESHINGGILGMVITGVLLIIIGLLVSRPHQV